MGRGWASRNYIVLYMDTSLSRVATSFMYSKIHIYLTNACTLKISICSVQFKTELLIKYLLQNPTSNSCNHFVINVSCKEHLPRLDI